eukprot:scaffold3816_cov26-Tisochrysis_lutea.AAC.3
MGSTSVCSYLQIRANNCGVMASDAFVPSVAHGLLLWVCMDRTEAPTEASPSLRQCCSHRPYHDAVCRHCLILLCLVVEEGTPQPVLYCTQCSHRPNLGRTCSFGIALP